MAIVEIDFEIQIGFGHGVHDEAAGAGKIASQVVPVSSTTAGPWFPQAVGMLSSQTMGSRPMVENDSSLQAPSPSSTNARTDRSCQLGLDLILKIAVQGAARGGSDRVVRNQPVTSASATGSWSKWICHLQGKVGGWWIPTRSIPPARQPVRQQRGHVDVHPARAGCRRYSP